MTYCSSRSIRYEFIARASFRFAAFRAVLSGLAIFSACRSSDSAVSTSVPGSQPTTVATRLALSLVIIFEIPSRIEMRCLQKFPYVPAGQVHHAVRLLPSLMKVTSYGSAEEPLTRKLSSSIVCSGALVSRLWPIQLLRNLARLLFARKYLCHFERQQHDRISCTL